jgi:hypothetical protein
MCIIMIDGNSWRLEFLATIKHIMGSHHELGFLNLFIFNPFVTLRFSAELPRAIYLNTSNTTMYGRSSRHNPFPLFYSCLIATSAIFYISCISAKAISSSFCSQAVLDAS